MSISSPSGVYRIDVVDQCGRAYRAVLANVQLVGEMALLPFLIMVGASLVTLIIPGGGLAARLLASIVQLIGFLVFGSVFLVRWHRFVLLGETIASGFLPPGWVPFFVAGVKLAALVV